MTTGPRRGHSPGTALLLGLAGLLVAAVAVSALVLAPAPQGAGAAGGRVTTAGSIAVGPSTTSYGRAPEVRGVERTGDAPLWWSLAGVSALVLVTGRMLRLSTRREPLP